MVLLLIVWVVGAMEVLKIDENQKITCTNARISHAEKGKMRDTLLYFTLLYFSFTRSFPNSQFPISWFRVKFSFLF